MKFTAISRICRFEGNDPMFDPVSGAEIADWIGIKPHKPREQKERGFDPPNPNSGELIGIHR